MLKAWITSGSRRACQCCCWWAAVGYGRRKPQAETAVGRKPGAEFLRR